MTRQRYSIKESLNRILRLFENKAIPTDAPEAVTGEVLSENEAFSDLAELFAGSLPGEQATLPSSILVTPIFSSLTSGTSTLSGNNGLYACNAVSGPITVTLPPVSLSSGYKYSILKTDSSANRVTISGYGAETIDGSNTQIIEAQYTAIQIICNGSNWWIV
jgi:hypothetical protein